MNYELDTYLDALKDFPEFETKLHTEKGDAICQKQDIFKGLMWFAYTDNFSNWHVLKTEHVREIVALNKEKKRATSLEDYALEVTAEPEKDFNNAMGQESLTRFDQPKKKKKPAKKRKPREAAAPTIAPKSNNVHAEQNQKPTNTPKKKPTIIIKNDAKK